MLGQDAQADVGAVVGAEALAGDRLAASIERPQDVDVPDRVDALEHAEDALEAGAGVDVRPRQRVPRAVGAPG